MSSRFNSDEEALGRLVRKAGDPTVAPDPQYAETLRASILDRVGPEQTSVTEAVQSVGSPFAITEERARIMIRITGLAVAATVLLALSTLAYFGGAGSIAFADVVKALDSLRTATYDFTSEIKSPVDGRMTTIKSKGYFLAPSLERVEMSMSVGSDTEATQSIMILDCLAAKGITLLPAQKKALVINIATTETSTGGTANMFEMVRQLIRKGSTDSDEKVKSLGEKEIGGKTVVGFRTQNNMADITLWADPQTAKLVRVDYDILSGDGRMVMTNIRYDVELDRSLFSLEPPEGYVIETQTIRPPAEEDLVHVLRLVAEYNDGTFPDSIGTNQKTFMMALQAESKTESEKLLNTPEVQERMAKLKAEYEGDKAGFMKAWMKQWMEMAEPITRRHTQKYMSGVMFYASLQPENDSHYAGKDVKLGTPNRPIFWYRPIGAEKYRVFNADLSIREVTPAEVKELPQAKTE